MSTDSQDPEDNGGGGTGLNANETYQEMPIEDELKNSYLTYAMSVISRVLCLMFAMVLSRHSGEFWSR